MIALEGWMDAVFRNDLKIAVCLSFTYHSSEATYLDGIRDFSDRLSQSLLLQENQESCRGR
jgi:hypothetical protein